MALRALLATVVILTAACGSEPTQEATTPTDDPTMPGVEQGSAEDPLPSGPCAELTADEIYDATGHEVEELTAGADRCTWNLTEEAAPLEGANEGEPAVLEVAAIDAASFGSARGRTDRETEPVDDLGADAFIQMGEDDSDTTLFVERGDGQFFSLRLQGALDGRNANVMALDELARRILE